MSRVRRHGGRAGSSVVGVAAEEEEDVGLRMSEYARVAIL